MLKNICCFTSIVSYLHLLKNIYLDLLYVYADLANRKILKVLFFCFFPISNTLL
jgi:hypothetical protein